MNKKRYIYTALLFFAAAVLVTLMIPSGGRYLQRFSMGERWRGETLTAPFDFSIRKSDGEIASDRRKAEKNFIPVYALDTAVAPAALRTLRTVLEDREKEEQAAGKPTARRNRQQKEATAFESALRFIFFKGLLPQPVASTETDDGSSHIRIENNSVLETVSTREVFTRASALAYLSDRLPGVADSLGIVPSDYLIPNLVYDKALNTALKESEQKNVATTRGIVHENELIVSHNQIIDRDVYAKLNSLKNEYEKRIGVGERYGWVLTGDFLLVFIVFGLTFLFLYYFKKDLFEKPSNVLFILLLYVLMTGICSAVNRSESLSIYLIPFAIVPIYILTFYDIRMSIYEHSTVLLLCSLIVPKPIEFFFVNFIAGIVGVFVLRRAYRRDRIFMATGAIFLSYCVTYLAMSLIQYGGTEGIDPWNFVWFGINAILFLGMYQLLYVIEKTFGFISDISLLELCDTNQKLLLELAHKAPGTFQHTLQVANLAEAAAKEIGANPLLARTGALYHDIGKMNNPAYYIENTAGTYNPHTSLTPKESAEVIRRHVTDGVALARKQGVRSVILDFITGHHGDSLIYYFYSKEKEKEGDAADDSAFRYPGPRPVSREVSICMMADAVEAASRSLSSYTPEEIGELVDKIIDIQIREGELTDSRLSFHDVGVIKEVFKSKLTNIYHSRISYPERE